MNDYSSIAKACQHFKHRVKPIALVTGCFDVLHVGHIRLLEFADDLGTVFVGVNSDRAVKELKGESRPINNQKDRLELLDHICTVYFTFVIDDTEITEAILQIKPDFWVKGSDYTLETLNQKERKAAESVDTKIVFAPLADGYSSTNIIERMKG